MSKINLLTTGQSNQLLTFIYGAIILWLSLTVLLISPLWVPIYALISSISRASKVFK